MTIVVIGDDHHSSLVDPEDGIEFCDFDNEVWPCRAVRSITGRSAVTRPAPEATHIGRGDAS